MSPNARTEVEGANPQKTWRKEPRSLWEARFFESAVPEPKGFERSRSYKSSRPSELPDVLYLGYLSSPSLPEEAGTGGFTDTSVPVSTPAR
jgi:hypothetical protein